MGLLISYCKKCDKSFSAFSTDENGGMLCKVCDEYNTRDDVGNALFDSDYHPKKRKIREHRAKIAQKIKDMLNGGN